MNITGKFEVHSFIPAEAIKLDQDYFPQPWTTPEWLSLNPEQNHLFTWKKVNAVIGQALFQYLKGDNTAHLLKILVLPDSRGKGETQLFWSEITKYLRSQGLQNIYLEVEATNARAIAFYEKSGFKILRKNKAYYSNGDDALIMSMTL